MDTATTPAPSKRDPAHESGARAVFWWMTAMGLATVALVIALVGLALPSGGGSGEGATGAQPGAGKTQVVEVELGDLYIKPAKIEVPAGAKITFKVTNKGAMQHDIKLDGKDGTGMIDPGGTATVTVGPVTADTQAWCTVPGHKAAGMVMDIKVTGGGGGDQAASGGGSGSGAAAEGDFAKIDSAAKPADDWTPRDPVLAPAPAGTEHRINLDATEKVLEVAPGVTQEMWTFNDQVPGPTLRGKVGDTFIVTLTNKGKMGHSIDFHSSMVAWSGPMRTIQPGESIEYKFVANYAGAWMYHCGTAPTLHHIGNGMAGAIIIDPPNLAPVDYEFAFTQAELYLGPEGQPGDLTKMMNDDWDAVVFNGYYNQYVYKPIQVDPNKRIRVWVVDDGPNENSSFHIVGTIFDTVFKEGDYLLRPNNPSRGGSQALDLQPAQGGFVEFTFAEVGYYPMVTHKFSNASKGAQGMFRAGDATMPDGSSH